MSDVGNHRWIVERWYESLANRDIEMFRSVHSEDCVYNISGHTPISGQVDFPDLMEHVLPVVFGALDPERFRFCVRYQIVCSDPERTVGVMEADGFGVNGKRYDQRYVHMFAFRETRICTVWEYFDTALAHEVIFAQAPDRIPGVRTDRFDQ